MNSISGRFDPILLPFAIIPLFASNGLSPVSLEFQVLRKRLIPIISLLLLILLLPGCGGSSAPGNHTSGITYRAFLSNSVSSPSSNAGIYIVNAASDVYPRGLAPISAGNTPGMMVVTPNRAQTLVFSGTNTQSSDNLFTIINNTSEQGAAHLTLPSYTESFVVSPDSSTAYVAIPNAPVVGLSPGEVEVVGLGTGSVAAQIFIPSVHYLSISNGGDRILAFTDVPASMGAPCPTTPASFFVITPSQLGIAPCVVIPVPGFDQPVQAFFSSDDTTAYVINCGAECGGTEASVQPFDLSTCNPNTLTCGSPGTAVPVCGAPQTAGAAPPCAASEALVLGSTMYLAGTPYDSSGESFTCLGAKGETLNCGMLTIFDLNTMSIVTSNIAITDGYHNRIAMGANGQLFIGAHTCTEIVPPENPPPGSEIRGCLSIYNSLNSAVGSVAPGGVLIPPVNGDATGLQPIANRTVVYVVQGGSLLIYDATSDALYYNPNNPNNPGEIFGLVGYFIDVKTVDY